VPLESMAWLRVLRPAGFALSMLGDRIPLVKFAHPVCSAIDGMATRFRSNRFRLETERTTRSVDVDLNDDSLIEQLREFAAAYSLRPTWDTDSLRWLLDQAAQNRSHGSLVCRAVYGKTARPLVVTCTTAVLTA
jgi:hypothetical protein